MTHIDFRPGEIVTLPLKERREENNQSYYIVTANGCEYPLRLFEFQKDDPLPVEISCLVKDMNDGQPVLVQNFAPLLKRFYADGQVYPFWVKRDCTGMSGGYYEVSDPYGFTFRLIFFGQAKLTVRQHIRCKVLSLRENKLRLELVQEEDTLVRLPFYTPVGLLESAGASAAMARWLERFLSLMPLFRDALEEMRQGEGRWVLTALGTLDKRLSQWVGPHGRHNVVRLETYKRVCLYLLEESDFLSGMGNNMSEERRQLSDCVRHADEYLEAVALISKGGHETYIEGMLQKMKASGYLYQPEKQLRLLICLFSLNPQLMEQKIQNVFDVITQGNADNWKTEPFRSAFLEQLDYYIDTCKDQADRAAVLEDKESRTERDKMVQAIAIQQLLASGSDKFDTQLNRARLYRYLTYFEGARPLKDTLLEKAFACLTGSMQEKPEYNWNDMRNLFLLSQKLSYASRTSLSKSGVQLCYEGCGAQLQLSYGFVQLLPLRGNRLNRKVLPDGLLPWHNMQVLLPDGGSAETVSPSTRDITVLQKFWKDIENSLFRPYIASPSVLQKPLHRLTLHADPGDSVVIRVLWQDPDRPDYFRCRMEACEFEGEGWLTLKNIVHYNVHASINDFCSEDGKPLLFTANVQGVNDQGEYAFNMLKEVGLYVKESYSEGEEYECFVADIGKGKYVCISEYGNSVYVEKEEDHPQVSVRDHIRVRLTDVRPTGYMVGEFLEVVEDPTFTVEEAFGTLMLNVSDGRVYEGPEEEEEENPDDPSEEALQTGVMMDEDYIRELILLIDRKAVLDEDFYKTYNYLSFDRLLAFMLDDRDLQRYYDQRLKFLQILHDFVENDKVDDDALQQYGTPNNDMLNRYPILKTRFTELQIVGCLGREEHNTFLWDICQGQQKHLAELSKLVLSYNLLNGFGMPQQKDAIHKKINEMLKLKMEMPELYTFGHEDQHTEFKTSVVFPPDNHMQPDMQRQTEEIMKVVCGFLNAEGGTLYLGVNDEGVACGLMADLEFFEGKHDKFDLHVRNAIKLSMGLLPNSLVSVVYPVCGGKFVYQMNIQPSAQPVKCYGEYFVRQGSSTEYFDADTFNAYFQNRNQNNVSR